MLFMRALFLASFLFGVSSRPAFAAQKVRALIVLNEGYRPEEYFEPRKIFDKEGFEVKVAGHYKGNILPSRRHVAETPPVPADFTFADASVRDFDVVVFVGGNGAWNDFLPNSDVHRILLDATKENKFTALICAATGLLATAQNLDGDHPQFKGKHVTGYFEVEGLLKRVGLVNYDKGADGKPYVVTEGRLITGRDPMSAQLFGQTIVKALKTSAK